MFQIFALRFYYVDYRGDKEKEEAYLDDEANFFKYFSGGPIVRVENYNAHVEGACLPKSLFSNYQENYTAKKVRIETERRVTLDELNGLLKGRLGAKDKGVIMIEAIEELKN